MTKQIHFSGDSFYDHLKIHKGHSNYICNNVQNDVGSTGRDPKNRFTKESDKVSNRACDIHHLFRYLLLHYYNIITNILLNRVMRSVEARQWNLRASKGALHIYLVLDLPFRPSYQTDIRALQSI